MWTQRDQLQAYQFLRRRIVSALQFGDANHPAAPARRVLVSTATGLGCALLVTAGFGVYGLLRPGSNTDWRQPGRVVIEKESGATYVLGADGALHPVLNYTSARLLAGAGARTVSVSARSLTGAPRGLPLGIAGAPTSLPARDALLTGAWTVCSARPAGLAGSAPATTTVTVGTAVAATALVPGRGVLVAAGGERAGGERYVVTDGRRLRLRGTAVAVALGYDGRAPVPVTDAWLNAIPAGPDLALIRVAGSGGRGPRVGDRSTAVGQVLVTRNVGNEARYYLVRADALAPISQTEAALVLGNRANRAAYRGGPPVAVEVAAADVAASGLVAATGPRSTGPQSPGSQSTGQSGDSLSGDSLSGDGPTGGRAAPDGPGGGFPRTVPELVEMPADQPALCGVHTDPATVRIATGAAGPAGAPAVPDQPTDGRTADRVQVPPGGGALVAQRQSPGADSGPVYLVTDQGVRHPLGDAETVAALGYGGVRPMPVAATLLALLPVGVGLDAESARQVVRP